MRNLKDTSLEWALKHVRKFYDSDFYPRLFEFDAIQHNWIKVKEELLKIDLDNYAPQTPFICLAPKKNDTFRVVHQLDPVDTLIYTALLHEFAEKIETYRIPNDKNIACSYRISPDIHGSFFGADLDGYTRFKSRSLGLAKENSSGFVLVCDITDFYNQIYLHRVTNVLEEAGITSPKVLEDFLSGLNTNISRGVPVGPAPSILVAEAIMGDVDKKIMSHTSRFTRYVDDMHIFFDSIEQAKFFLHELTKYLYSNHRLVLSSDKTFIVDSPKFIETYFEDEEKIEQKAIHEKLAESADHDFYYYTEPEIPDFEDLESPEKFTIRSEAYNEVFQRALEFDVIDLGIMRHLLRKAGKYKVRSLLPLIFENFRTILPIIRELVVYFERVLNEKSVKKYQAEFQEILDDEYVQLPFVNIWIYTLLQNPVFNFIELKIDYSRILRVREQALIALRLNDRTWIKDHKDGLDVLGPWDKRAILHSAVILSSDELKHWAGLVSSRGNILDKAVAAYVIAEKKK
ncbi:RNA-directed DNA polymerase [Sanyastnella coralliicola]|uniref:RNA-directed DNA polymerase n=1 Tax=Sanyastnella coralliicola TaxID=3069118 RepID=UPI0027B96C2D|nr:RNA-directed DNA polymerase [Longitalea sp. SCSIO 12813]